MVSASICFSSFDWQTIMFVLILMGAMFIITHFVEHEKIRDHIQEINGELISIKYNDMLIFRIYSRKYSVIWKDQLGRILKANCIMTPWSKVYFYGEEVIDSKQKK
jgi:hypothetical protein